MAGQGFLLRVSNILGTSRTLLKNRFLQVNAQPQASGLKHSITDKLKEMKLPEKPKRPLTPYFRFIQDHRQALLKQNPDLKVTEITKQCAQDWKSVHLTVKQKYQQEYESELDAYTGKLMEYSAKLTPEQKEFLKAVNIEQKKSKKKREIRKQLRDANRPKRPIGAYMLYVMESAKRSDKNYAKLLVDMKDSWASLPVDEKRKYVEASENAKKQYDKDLEAWELKMIQEGHEDLVRLKTLAEKRPATSRNDKKSKRE